MQRKRSTLVVIGNSSSFVYLLGRYAGRIGCSVTVALPSESAEAIHRLEPVAVVFSSVEVLEASQSLLAGLANFDVPIVVCSSIADQVRPRELGADVCLLHPVTYDDFQSALTNAATSKRA